MKNQPQLQMELWPIYLAMQEKADMRWQPPPVEREKREEKTDGPKPNVPTEE